MRALLHKLTGLPVHSSAVLHVLGTAAAFGAGVAVLPHLAGPAGLSAGDHAGSAAHRTLIAIPASLPRTGAVASPSGVSITVFASAAPEMVDWLERELAPA